MTKCSQRTKVIAPSDDVDGDWMTIAIVANKECNDYVLYAKITVLRMRMATLVMMTGDDSSNSDDMTHDDDIHMLMVNTTMLTIDFDDAEANGDDIDAEAIMPTQKIVIDLN